MLRMIGTGMVAATLVCGRERVDDAGGRGRFVGREIGAAQRHLAGTDVRGQDVADGRRPKEV